jgi:hypothetical protein
MSQEHNRLDATKDPSGQRPIPATWRPTLREIVARLAGLEYSLRGLSSVDVSPTTASQIEQYVIDYGETLIELPDESWTSSVTQWMGSHWDALVDLWTAESGKSDLVLSVRVFEEGKGFRFEVNGVYVP